MDKSRATAGWKALLLATSACSAAWSMPANAQPVTQGAGEEGSGDAAASADGSGTIVVTGSRIRRSDFEANSPIITLEEDFFQQSSTSAIEQQLNKLPQFTVSQSSTLSNNQGYLAPAAQDIQPNATNTPGAATVSLRGIGSNRTLVLIDGRRGAPGNASGSVDVSTIPSAALQRVEVISGGASATYGADAIAGVTNFILKRDVTRLELDANLGISQYGDALDYQISGIVGADLADGRGNVSLAVALNTREEAFERDRPWYRDLWNNPNVGSGGFGGNPRPGANLQNVSPAAVAAVFGNEFPLDPANTSLTVYGNRDGSLFTTGFESPGVNAFQPWAEADASGSWHETAVGTRSYNNTSNYLTVPTTRYNALARADYELNDWIGMFATAMFSHSETYTRTEASRIQSGWSVDIPWGTGVYTGNASVPSSVIRTGDSFTDPFTFVTSPYIDPTPGNLADNPTNAAFQALYGANLACARNPIGGCSDTQAFEQVIPQDLQILLNSRQRPAQFGDPGYIFGAPAEAQPLVSLANDPIDLTAMFPNKRETFSDVQTYNIVAGFEGSVPGTDWTWEAFANHSVSTTSSRQTGMYSLGRVRAVYSAPNFGQGFNYRGNPEDDGFGAVTGRCTSGLDVFNVQGNAGNISADCREAIASDINTKSEMRQTIAEFNVQGGLFDLPAGQLRFAAGASYRELDYQFVTDGLTGYGRSFLDQAIGIYPSSNSDAFMSVNEVYGELLVPVVRDLPLIKSFNLELGGRMSNYSTTGTSYTFKVLGDWEVTDWLRFRGGFNRAERAPNLAELFLSPQQTFGVDTVGDLCSTRLANPASANPETNPGGAADVKAACLALMTRDNGGTPIPETDFFSYYGTFFSPFQPNGAGFSFSSAVGNSVYRDTINPGIDPLRPEVAHTWTAGAVIQSPVASGPLSRLQLSVDYFNIKIEDPIGLLSVGAMQQLCLDPTYNPLIGGAAGPDGIAGTADDSAAAAIATAECSQVARSPSTGFSGLNSNAMTTTYRNDGLVKLSGIDAQLSWSSNLGPGTVFASVNGSYMLDFKVKELDPAPLVDYVGTIGTGVKGLNFGGSIEYRIFASLGYNWGPANLSLQWQHTPATEDTQEAISPTEDPGYPSSNTFNLNGGYQVNEDIRIRFGIDNLFYKRPRLINVDQDADPAEGELTGGSWNYFDDTQGRRFTLGANIRF
jgi:outer membrane receptor protein involved in Fe transport